MSKQTCELLLLKLVNYSFSYCDH